MKTTAHSVAKAHGMMDAGEVDLLKRCAKELPEKPVCVNIGAGFGTSALAILEEKRDAFIFSVDIKPRPEEKKSVASAGFSPHQVVRVLGNSGYIGQHWPYNDIDLLFVDGAHDNASVQRDIDAWVPNVKTGGFILFHDYKHRNLPDLTGIVNRAMRKHEYIGESRYLVAFKK